MRASLLTGLCLSLSLAACAPPENMTGTDAGYAAPAALNLTLPELSEKLAAGDLTSVQLTQMYLDRIAAIDRQGPALQSFISVNPDALTLAEQSDARRADGKALGPLDGLAIALKDNIETADNMPTTAGALALKDNVTGRDSPLAAGLREGGAIIIGKTNLSQWANFRSSDSLSGWSALGGQVRNPHMLDRNPCGSSSGTGAAIAASLATGGVGTETNGSIICPSNVNGIVGFKPTVGLVAQDYIVPISVSQDTAGPMTKSVKGAAMMLSAMSGAAADYAAGLDAKSLSGLRVGVMNFARNENSDINARLNAAIEILEAQGAVTVAIDEFEVEAEDFWGKARSVLEYEFKDGMDLYLASTPDAVTARSLAQVIAFNSDNADAEMALFGQDILESSDAKGSLDDNDYKDALATVQKAAGADGIDRLLSEHNVSVLVGPSGPVSPRIDPVNGDVWPAWAGAGYLAAIAGYPNLTVPMGDIHGVPIGLSFMGAKDSDGQILSYGYAYEQASRLRVTPQFLKTAEDRPEIKAAMAAE